MNLETFRNPQDPEVIPDDWYWERIRNWRNEALRNSDWSQLPDSSADAAVWATYRQELRDLPASGTLDQIVFPVEP